MAGDAGGERAKHGGDGEASESSEDDGSALLDSAEREAADDYDSANEVCSLECVLYRMCSLHHVFSIECVLYIMCSL